MGAKAVGIGCMAYYWIITTSPVTQPGLGLSFLTRDKPWSSGFVQSSRHPVTVLQIEQCAQGHLGIGEEDMSYPIALYEAAHFRCME
jgi:hypothetical protein